jgi:hypothetical protein
VATYPDPEVAAALVAPTRTWDFRYDRVDLDGNVTGTEEVLAASVAYNDLADKIKRTCSVTLRGTTTFDPLSDRLRPYALLRMPDGGWHDFPLGTFYLPTTGRVRLPTAGKDTIQVQGYDSVQQTLVEDKVMDRYVVDTGTAYTTAVQTVLTGAGLGTGQITVSPLTLPGPMEWEPGTEKLRIVNDLLAAIDYRPIGSSPLGVPRAVPYLEPSQAPVVWEYGIDSESVLRPDVDVEFDLFNIPNAWIAVVSEADRPPLVAKLVNDDEADPLSTVNRGRTIVQVLTTDQTAQAADAAVLQAKVERAALEARSVYEIARPTTGLMPFHGEGDVCLLDYGEGPLRFRQAEWAMTLKAGGEMTHRFRRVVTV